MREDILVLVAEGHVSQVCGTVSVVVEPPEVNDVPHLDRHRVQLCRLEQLSA
ncbi:hypothetical protein [Streptomyces sp. NPDC005303]|uniref:hypothetical protein n=1 Tax=Streptomyces sp. NPDC005303 TaxID=3155713 RepID=UPI0033AC2EA0